MKSKATDSQHMAQFRMDRRAVLNGGLAMGAAALVSAPRAFAAGPEAGEAFTPDTVRRLAERLSKTEFARPRVDLPEPFNNLSYDQYRDIRFRPDQSVWRGDKLDFELQLFPLGFLYDIPVEIWLVDGDKPRQLKADNKMFSLGPLITKPNDAAPYAFSGFRVHGPLNRSDYFDEYAVFQGASYLRAVARGQVYGMSARGLAINTARPGGEEFPFFRSFWIEKPRPGNSQLVVHALLDSPSTTGAYKYVIQSGTATVMDVEVTLYPRKPMPHIGLAPLTSMFLYGPASRRVAADFRPRVHDSEGLAILNGNGERLWRPLVNPRKLQTSAFLDKDIKGFGLSQRDRGFTNFEDLEAHYERRPTVWVEPKGAWGSGFVELIEIPAEEEIHDNIVAYWKPSEELKPGQPYSLAYRLTWTDSIPVAWTGARVRRTSLATTRKAGNLLFVVDFDGPALKDLRELPIAHVYVSAGILSNIVVQPNPEISGVRATFELNPNGAELVEMRMALKVNDQPISESWLYRWTR